MWRTRRLQLAIGVVDVHSKTGSGGSTIVLVHGIGVSSNYFKSFADKFESHDVYMIDLPGYGQTPNPKHVLRIDQLAQAVSEVIVQLNIDKPVVTGHSMGCQIVARLVKEVPSLCSKYILLSPTVNPAERIRSVQLLRLLQDSLREPFKLNMTIIKDYVHMGLWRYLKTSKFMLDDHIERYISECHLPGLFVAGKDDRIAPSSWVQRLSRLAPQPQFIEIEGAPHVVHYHHPENLVDICQKFIEL